MRPKEVHCVCPFLKGKPMNMGEFLELSESGHTTEAGLNFQGVDAIRLTSFLVQTCKSRHYKVDGHSIEGGTILYLASESIGEKAYYLLTAYIKETDGLTKVMLRAVSDKPHGLNGFLNEMLGSIRHIVGMVQSAREIGVIRKEQVINIIDSVVQRTTFAGGEGAAEVNIESSVVQRTEFKGDDGQKRREEERLRQEREEVEERKRQVEQERLRKQKEEEERAKKEREVQEQQRIEEEERKRKEAQERLQKQKAEEERARVQRLQMQESARGEGEHKEGGHAARQRLIFLAFVVIGVLVVGYWMMNPGSDNIDAVVEPSSSNIAGVEATVVQTSQVSPADSPAAVTALSAETSKTVTNSIGMEFVLIPAGEFKMGSPSGEEDRLDIEGLVHTVKIEKAYYLGNYEVTQKQWREVMGINPSNFKGDNLPVENVSWNDAQDFVKKLNEKEGTDKYRLPSEAEWEYAARAGTTTRYSFGNDDSDLGDYAWYNYNSSRKTHPVGQKQPNPWGLYDMHGNVWEWVQDEWHSDYNGAPTDGSAWEDGSNSYRVWRGGGWISIAGFCRSAQRDTRYSIVTGDHFPYLGFRLLQEV